MNDEELGIILTELRETRKELSEKLDGFGMRLSDHQLDDQKILGRFDHRLAIVESGFKSIKWFSRSVIVACLTLVGDILLNHVPRWLGKH